MSWSNVQTTGGFGASSPFTQTYGSNLGSGRLLLAWVGYNIATGSPTVSDPTHGTWTPIPSSLIQNVYSCGWFYVPSSIGGVAPVVTVTVAGALSNLNLHIFEYSSTKPLNVDAVSTTPGSTANPSVTIDPTGANQLIVGGCMTAGNVTAGASYTARNLTSGNGTEEITSHTQDGSPIAVNFVDSNNNWVLSAATFVEGSNTLVNPDYSRFPK